MEAIYFVVILLAGTAVLATVARKAGLPYPILLVVGGLGLGLVADGMGIAPIELEPDLVFLLLLPPVLFSAAYLSSVRDLRANVRPIALLAIGLVLATTVAVAVVAEALIPGMGWPVAFLLGAIVAPPDAAAITSILRRLGVPRRVITVAEGESLLNDATALVLYRIALGAVSTGAFSLVEAVADFVVVGIGGVVVGLGVIGVALPIFRRIDDPPVETTLSFLIPIVSYFAAEELGVSGVLSTVTAGLVLGRQAPRVLASDTRVFATGAWQLALFIINGIVFGAIGLQLPAIVRELAGFSPGQLALWAIAVSAVVILVRIAWLYPATYIPRWVSAKIRRDDPAPPPSTVFILAWAGLRGIVSLAAALALPHTLANGQPFEQRGLVLFLTFSVILVTLVGQGLTLPLVVRAISPESDGSTEAEERTARLAAAEAALDRLPALRREWPGHLPLIDSLQTMYQHRVEHLPSDDGSDIEHLDQELVEHQLIRSAVIEAERDAIIQLRDEGTIDDHVLRVVERDIDLEQLRMEA